MKNLFILTIASIVIFSCSQKISPSNAASELYGNWQWASSSGGYAPKTITPATEGYNKTISFSNTGIYSEHQSNSTSKTGTFTIAKAKSIYTADPSFVISYDGMGQFSKKQSFQMKGDTLLLLDECYDCYKHTYIRIK